MDIYSKLIDVTDYWTNQVVATRQYYYVVDDAGCMVIFCPEELRESLNYRKQYVLKDPEYLMERAKLTLEDINMIFEDLEEFVDSLDEDKMKNIVANMPRLKDGRIRNATIPVYNSNLSIWDDFRAITWQFISYSMPIPKSLENEAKSLNVKDAFCISFDMNRPYDKNEICIANPDGTFNKLEYKPNSYIPNDQLVPGKLYTDKKDNELLYIGKLQLKCNNRVYETEPYTFIKLTKKRKEDLAKAKTFEEWFTPYYEKVVRSKRIFEIWDSSLKCAESFKVCFEVGTAFSAQDTQCTIKCSTGKETYSFIVPAIGVKPVYCVHEQTDPNGWDYYELRGTWATKEKAKEQMAELKAANPKYKYKITTGYESADKTIKEGPVKKR